MNQSGNWDNSTSSQSLNNNSINVDSNIITSSTIEPTNVNDQRRQISSDQTPQSNINASSIINNDTGTVNSSSQSIDTSHRFYDLIHDHTTQLEVQMQPQFTTEEIHNSMNNGRNSSFSSSNFEEPHNLRHTTNDFMQLINEDDELENDERLQETLERNPHHASSFTVEPDDEDNVDDDNDDDDFYGEDDDEDSSNDVEEDSDDFEAIDHDMISHGTTTSNIYHQRSTGQLEEDEVMDEDEDDNGEGDEDDEDLEELIPEEENNTGSSQPSLEQIQKVYYTRGLQELEALQLVDLSQLATWKLSSYKQGCGLAQLREDNPETYWQSDGSNGGNNTNPNSSNLVNNHLSNPHSVTIQFIKKVSLERISIFTNYSLDESYTPSKIKIMAGSSEGWDLIEVCTVNFNQPIGWSHIIFNGMRKDAVLKCFMIKIFILANHQEGKDSHIRAIRCFGRKNQPQRSLRNDFDSRGIIEHSDMLKDLSLASGSRSLSGISLNQRVLSCSTNKDDREPMEAEEEREEEDNFDDDNSKLDPETSRILQNVNDVIRNNEGFRSIELTSVSSIR
ncbi:uncharacterized protein KGF55_004853 [Candida pseudojiufengensis]|uniref:uncharacterized protein n=1 Tax=Candida pseudojiufengensis TaxID=497109 RepID=UPI0022241E3D|nr:uncharacterized protein KGF55_004853 [Candida pseudojiufengensis]KAI5960130.1 hypothetical protein KGF55_004853 [Candida pseudojiufengensis]